MAVAQLCSAFKLAKRRAVARLLYKNMSDAQRNTERELQRAWRLKNSERRRKIVRAGNYRMKARE